MPLEDIPPAVKEFLNISDPNSLQIESRIISRTVNVEEVRKTAKDFYLNKLLPYYEAKDLHASTGIFNFLFEPLRNAYFHGGKRSIGIERIEFDLYLAPVSFVARYWDGGDYFKRREIKEHWESRKFFPEKHIVENNQGECGGGAGTPLIYHHADFIHVDNPGGTLFIGASVKNDFFSAKTHI